LDLPKLRQKQQLQGLLCQELKGSIKIFVLFPKGSRNVQRDGQIEGDISSQEEESEKVTILAKEASFQPDIFAACRPIAIAELADRGLQFHNMKTPSAHTLLIFRDIQAGEMKLIIGGQLDYKGPPPPAPGISISVDVGMLFHWPTSLVQRDASSRL
jgi:hypothetical protein